MGENVGGGGRDKKRKGSPSILKLNKYYEFIQEIIRRILEAKNTLRLARLNTHTGWLFHCCRRNDE